MCVGGYKIRDRNRKGGWEREIEREREREREESVCAYVWERESHGKRKVCV